jgi:hypothetical protein
VQLEQLLQAVLEKVLQAWVWKNPEPQLLQDVQMVLLPILQLRAVN